MNGKLPEPVYNCLKAAVRQLTDPERMSDRVRAVLIDDENVKLYLDSWVIPNMEGVLEWSDGKTSAKSLTVFR